MIDCPSDDDLSGFLNDSLPSDRLTGVAIHVDGCASCQGRLDKLTHDADGAIARYKDLSSIRPTRIGAVVSSPDAGTLIIGSNPLPHTPLKGLPTIPGFEVLAEIGRGGMGVVYKARHRRLNRLVALKMVLAGVAADARLVQRFLFEAEILARVQHPQIVQVFEVDTDLGVNGIPIPYLAMELLEGGSLSSRLRQQRRADGSRRRPRETTGGCLEPRLAAELVEGLARAVHRAHLQGVIHRDLKPANILFPKEELGVPHMDLRPAKLKTSGASFSNVSSSHHTQLPKVTDFGLAKFTQDAGADLTASGQVVGTPHYMAPEQAAGSREIGPAVDVYALGAILFECLTGRPPFEGKEPMSVLLKVVNDPTPDVRALCQGLHQDLAAVVMQCLAKDPRRRYASAVDLADDLRRFLDNRPTVARHASAPERAWLWSKRNPAVAGLLALLAAVLLGAFIAITTFWVRAEETATQEHAAKEQAKLAEASALRSQQESARSLHEARRQKANADRNRTELEFASAVNCCEEGRVAQGLDSFIRTVELAEATGAVEMARVARVNLAAWPQALPRQRKIFTQDFQPRDIAFFPDGRHGVVASRASNLFLWDTTTDRKVLTYRTSYKFMSPSVSGITLAFTFWTTAVSPNGKTVVAGGSDGRVWIWDAGQAEPLGILPAAKADDDVWAVAFAPDGTVWATDGGNGVRRWDLTQMKSIATLAGLPAPDAMLQSLTAAADGKHLFTGDRRGVIQEWDVVSQKPLRAWKASGWVSALALSPGDTHLAATGTDGMVRVIELTSGREFPPISLTGAYGKGVAFAPNQSLLIASDADGNVRGWNWRTGVPVGVPLRLSGEILAPRFLPNSQEFVIPAGNTVQRCRLADPQGQLLFLGKDVAIRGLDFAPAGDRLAIAHANYVSEFNLATAEECRSPELPTFTLSIRYDADPNRQRIIRGYREGVDVLNLPGFSRDLAVRNGDRTIGIDFSPGGEHLFMLNRDSVSRWNPTSLARPVSRLRDAEMPNGMETTTMSIRPDGRELLFAYANKLIFLDTHNLEKTRPSWVLGDDILEAKYLPGGTRILVGRRDSVAQVLDANTGEPVGRPLTHTSAVLSLAVRPDGQLLLTGSRDGTARFWDAATGLPLGPPLRHAGPVTHLGFNPKGLQVASGTGVGEVNLWPLPPPPLSGSLEELQAMRQKLTK